MVSVVSWKPLSITATRFCGNSRKVYSVMWLCVADVMCGVNLGPCWNSEMLHPAWSYFPLKQPMTTMVCLLLYKNGWMELWPELWPAGQLQPARAAFKQETHSCLCQSLKWLREWLCAERVCCFGSIFSLHCYYWISNCEKIKKFKKATIYCT